MIRLRVGYLITGIITGLLLVFSFLGTIPDGKLHIVFCDVGQGDGIYIRFPDGRDMVIDGGPTGTKFMSCLSRHMPFWDRALDMALLTHPQKDHMEGLLETLRRYQVRYLLRSDVANATEGYTALQNLRKEKNVTEKFMTSGETVDVGTAHLTILWPSTSQITMMKPPATSRLPASLHQGGLESGESVLGASASEANVNDASIVFSLSYGVFDAVFMGDADSHIQPALGTSLQGTGQKDIARDGVLDLFKVPHHGSRTGMTDAFLQKISFTRLVLVKQESSLMEKAPLAVISVGKNSYGHPDAGIVKKLGLEGFDVLRTDQSGDIEVISDGAGWEVKTGR